MTQVLKAICGSKDRPLKIGDMLIPCYVLENGSRVLRSKAINSALGFSASQNVVFYGFLDNPDLKPFIDLRLVDVLTNPIRFMRPGRGGKLAMGYEAEVFLKICTALVAAGQAPKIANDPHYYSIIKRAKSVLRKFTGVSINVVVDQVSGYQDLSQKLQLKEVLQKTIEQPLLEWFLLFPRDFFEELCRLKNRTLDDRLMEKGSMIKKYTNEYVFEKLPPHIIQIITTAHPKNKQDTFLPKLDERVSLDIGLPFFKMQIFCILKLMKIAHNWQHFERYFAQAFPEQV